MKQKKNTEVIRAVCSINCESAGIFVCFFPKLYPQMQLWTAENGMVYERITRSC